MLFFRTFFLTGAVSGLLGYVRLRPGEPGIRLTLFNVYIRGVPFGSIVVSLVLASVLSLFDSVVPRSFVDVNADLFWIGEGIMLGVVWALFSHFFFGPFLDEVEKEAEKQQKEREKSASQDIRH